jgi:hypothetical protein
MDEALVGVAEAAAPLPVEPTAAIDEGLAKGFSLSRIRSVNGANDDQ